MIINNEAQMNHPFCIQSITLFFSNFVKGRGDFNIRKCFKAGHKSNWKNNHRNAKSHRKKLEIKMKCSKY